MLIKPKGEILVTFPTEAEYIVNSRSIIHISVDSNGFLEPPWESGRWFSPHTVPFTTPVVLANGRLRYLVTLDLRAKPGFSYLKITLTRTIITLKRRQLSN